MHNEARKPLAAFKSSPQLPIKQLKPTGRHP